MVSTTNDRKAKSKNQKKLFNLLVITNRGDIFRPIRVVAVFNSAHLTSDPELLNVYTATCLSYFFYEPDLNDIKRPDCWECHRKQIKYSGKQNTFKSQ